MGLQDAIVILCLSCVLLFSCVRSQCPSGWFGFDCNYKCRCESNACDDSGECIGDAICTVGWFGPGCQYADVAFHTPLNPIVVDGNDSTCLSGSLPQVSVKLNESSFYTWIRVKVSAAGSANLKFLSVSIWSPFYKVTCDNMKKHYVDQSTLDIHCDIDEGVTNITFVGMAAGHLCSVYFSGGRNVAVREQATQGTTYVETRNGTNISFAAHLAVDGNREQSYYKGLSCSTTIVGLPTDPLPRWILTLSEQRRVFKMVIYNRGDAQLDRLRGFNVEVYTTPSRLVFNLSDSNQHGLANYTFNFSPGLVQKVAISVNNSERILTLCEVELYGDSICDGRHYGRDCELECHCSTGEDCFVATGGCPSLCPAGWHGPNCSKTCDAETFGGDCNSTCSKNCEKNVNPSMPSCDREIGACASGCKRGYTGETCRKTCDAGTFGDDCNSNCSQFCQTNVNTSMSSCAPDTGKCTRGCEGGYKGANCSTKCDAGRFGDNCSSSCSSACAATGNANASPCGNENGVCIMGCKKGYAGANCERKCSGKECTNRVTCSPHCAPTPDGNSAVCNLATGKCVMGCGIGFTGLTCASECAAGKFGDNCSSTCSPKCAAADSQNKARCDSQTGACIKPTIQSESSDNIPYIVSACLVMATAAFITYCFCTRRQMRPKEEHAEGQNL